MSSRLRALLIVLLAVACAACSTQRTITIASDPPGARVWIEGVERGTTPLTVPFVYYGDADVRLEKEGYASVATVLVVPTQIDGYPLVDLPFELTVRRRHFEWKATLEELAPEHGETEIQSIRDRADAMRERTRREATPEALKRPVQNEWPARPEARPVDAPPPLARPTGGG